MQSVTVSVWPSDGLWLEPVWTKALVFHKGEEQLLELEKDVTASDCVCSQPVLEVLGWEEVTMHSIGSHSNSNTCTWNQSQLVLASAALAT